MVEILDGKKVATEIKQKVTHAVQEQGIQPCLATVLAGNDPASKVYVRNKQKDCVECGIKSHPVYVAGDVSEDALVDLVKNLSDDANIHALLLLTIVDAVIADTQKDSSYVFS